MKQGFVRLGIFIILMTPLVIFSFTFMADRDRDIPLLKIERSLDDSVVCGKIKIIPPPDYIQRFYMKPKYWVL